MKQPAESCDAVDVLVVGASVRSAVQSAVRAGLRPWAVDLFGDEDTRESAKAYRKISSYREIPAVIADWPIMPWLMTGALENYPRLIERLSRIRPHWGHSTETIRQVRNPRRLQRALSNANFAALNIWPDNSPPPADGRWMLKPLRTAGGQGVFVWDEKSFPLPEVQTTLRNPHVFQEKANGEAMSALFLSSENETSLRGCGRLLKGTNPANPFGFGGMIGPICLPAELERRIENIGGVLGERFNLRGLWGLDFMRDGSEVWVAEINPRFTASVEVYEQAYGVSLLRWHRSVFEAGIAIDKLPQRNSLTVGKAVVYTDRDMQVPSWEHWIGLRARLLPELSSLADRPAAGTIVPQGHPVCTLLAAGMNESDCRAKLNGRLKELQTHFQRAGQDISFPAIELL